MPAANWNGSTGFQFTATDGGGLPDATPASATINVAAVNDEPVANNVFASGNEDDPQIAVTLTGSDVEGPIASFRLLGLPAPATGTLYSDAGLTVARRDRHRLCRQRQRADAVLRARGQLERPDRLPVHDHRRGGLSDATPANATIAVAAVNDAPVANNVIANGNEDDAQIAITLTGGDVDGPVASFRITSALPANGTLYTNAGLTTVAVSGIDYAAAGNALTLYFVPAANWNGSTAFQFTATDGGGLSDATPATATINVAPVNDAPVANDVVANGNEDDAQIAITLTGSDVEGPVASFRITGALPANGTLYTDAALTTRRRLGHRLRRGRQRADALLRARGKLERLDRLPVHRHRRRRPARPESGQRDDQRRRGERRAGGEQRRSPTATRTTPQIAITLTGSDVEGPVASFRITGALPANGTLYTDAVLTTVAVSGIDYAAAGNALTLYFVPAANWNGSTGFQFTATDGGGLVDATPGHRDDQRRRGRTTRRRRTTSSPTATKTIRRSRSPSPAPTSRARSRASASPARCRRTARSTPMRG